MNSSLGKALGEVNRKPMRASARYTAGPALNTTFSTKFIVFYQLLTSQIIVAIAGLLPQLRRKRVAPPICPSLPST